MNSRLVINRKDTSVFCELIGDWSIQGSSDTEIKKWETFWRTEETSNIKECEFFLSEDIVWDTKLVLFLIQVKEQLGTNEIVFLSDSLPDKLRRLVDFKHMDSLRQNRREKFSKEQKHPSVYSLISWVFPFLAFWGKWLFSITRLSLGKSHMRVGDFIKACRDCGALGLPIITLISFLTGLTMAFVGSVQLQKFNAMIYVADLVSLAMVREMGPLMVAIILAGRTGASYAAELGSMKLSEEIDSLRTFGVSVMDFLVLPRVLAVLFMTPLLTLYADFIGILGGLSVGVQIMDFSVTHYMEQTQSALVDMWEVYSGLCKSLVFGVVIGLVGCYKGLNTGINSSELGRSVTSSVVLSITLIVVCDASFEAIFSFFDLR